MAILTSNFLSKSLGRVVPFNAILPTCDFSEVLNPLSKTYDDPKPLRTLYLLHGICGDYTDWMTYSRVAQYAEEKRLAVIMPSGDNSFYTDNVAHNRYSEYIGEELVKMTRSIFNLSAKREDTFIGGLSMGGYGAHRIGLMYNNTFSKIISLSLANIRYEDMLNSTEDSHLFFMRKSYFEHVFGDLTKLKDSDMNLYTLAKNASGTDIYMACGTEDLFISNNREYSRHLQNSGANLTYAEAPGGHDWNFWDTYIKHAINWI